jgi:hypothetical protein
MSGSAEDNLCHKTVFSCPLRLGCRVCGKTAGHLLPDSIEEIISIAARLIGAAQFRQIVIGIASDLRLTPITPKTGSLFHAESQPCEPLKLTACGRLSSL